MADAPPSGTGQVKEVTVVLYKKQLADRQAFDPVALPPGAQLVFRWDHALAAPLDSAGGAGCSSQHSITMEVVNAPAGVGYRVHGAFTVTLRDGAGGERRQSNWVHGNGQIFRTLVEGPTEVRCTVRVFYYTGGPGQQAAPEAVAGPAPSDPVRGDDSSYSLADLRRQACRIDVFLECTDGALLPAHQTVLSSRSAGLRNYFQRAVGPQSPRIVVDCSAAVADAFLAYFYSDNGALCDLTQSLEDLLRVLRLADRYDVERLRDECDRQLRVAAADADTALAVLSAALTAPGSGLPTLPEDVVDAAVRAVLDSWATVTATAAWQRFCAAHPCIAAMLRAAHDARGANNGPDAGAGCSSKR